MDKYNKIVFTWPSDNNACMVEPHAHFDLEIFGQITILNWTELIAHNLRVSDLFVHSFFILKYQWIPCYWNYLSAKFYRWITLHTSAIAVKRIKQLFHQTIADIIRFKLIAFICSYCCFAWCQNSMSSFDGLIGMLCGISVYCINFLYDFQIQCNF